MTETDLARLHLIQQHYDKSQRFTAHCERALDPRRILSRRIERHVRERIEAAGFVCAKTTHKANYDLLVQGIRVEVKASRWDGLRYEANLRSNDADLLVFMCIDDTHPCIRDRVYSRAESVSCAFVIPFDQVAGKTVIKITRHDPADYIGQFTPYYEAWDLLDDLIRAGRNAWQPALLAPCTWDFPGVWKAQGSEVQK